MPTTYVIIVTFSLVLGTIGGMVMRRAHATPVQRIVGTGALFFIGVLVAVGVSRLS